MDDENGWSKIRDKRPGKFQKIELRILDPAVTYWSKGISKFRRMIMDHVEWRPTDKMTDYEKESYNRIRREFHG